MKYMTSMQAAKKWDLTKRRVNSLCQEGAIPGAVKDGYRWMIPEEAHYLSGRREKTGKLMVREVGNYYARRALPIGVSDFRNAVKNYYYVDKTLLIRDLLDYRPLVSLFTRPRRFGKTLNMDMLRVFFELSEEDTSVYFEGTDIWKYGEQYREEQGKYPVIFFTFKDIKFSKWHDTFLNLREVVRSEYRRHIYLMDSERLSEVDKEYFEKVLDGSLENALFTTTLAKLSYFLNLHHGKAPMIMIDEYDTPIQQGFVYDYYDEVVEFMRNFLSGGLKDNQNLTMAFLTGILRVAKESIFSGLNNLNVNSVLEERYSQYFGFTEKEVQNMLEEYGYEDKFSEVVEWYDGYHFGDTEIFNPWSVLNYVDADCIPKTFWQATGSNEIIGEIIHEAASDVVEQMRQLISGKCVEAYVDTAVVYPEIRDNPSSIFSFLLMAGYLTVRSEQKFYDGNSFCQVCIPNREISIAYEKEILAKLKNILPQSTSIAIQQALFNRNSEKIREEVEKFLVRTVSFHDVAAEGFYHGLILGMSAVFNNYYEITSNREEGNGRYDIQMKPYNKHMPGYVIELKALTQKVSEETEVAGKLEKMALEAVEQIDKREYFVGLQRYGCDKIVKMGIAFYKKMCKVSIQGMEA